MIVIRSLPDETSPAGAASSPYGSRSPPRINTFRVSADMSRLEKILPHVYRFQDSCNAYVVTHDDRALVIDCSSGSVSDAITEDLSRKVDWLLFTHHHRDQCFGAKRLVDAEARIAVPAHERYLFERANDYWQQKRLFDNYNDRSTFFSIGENLPVAESLVDYERFEWGPYSFFVLPTPGHTQGSVTLVADIDGQTVAFTGDLLYDGGKLYQLHAMEYEYGDLVGATLVSQSIHALQKRQPTIALPSHGPVITDPQVCIDQLHERIQALADLSRDRLGVGPDRRLPHEIRMEQISPHLLWGTENTCSNFYVVKSDSGKALFIDYPYYAAGFFLTALHSPEPFAALRFTEHHLDELREEWGVTEFDVVVATHIHDDHVCGIPYLQRFHNTSCWTLEDVAKVLERPTDWNTPCLFETPIRVDRRLKDGERFEWEGFQFEIVFYPGQTEFHAAILGEIDNRRVLFSGDSSYPLKRYLPESSSEWMVNSVLRNSVTFDMHRKCADELERLRPQLVCPGHGPFWDVPDEAFAEHRHYVERKEAIWRDLVPEPADLGIDLFWARLIPYQSSLRPGETREFTLELRNSFGEQTTIEATLCSELELEVEPRTAKLTLPAAAKGSLRLSATVPASAPVDPHRRHLLTVHLTVNGRPHGPVTEAILVVK